MRAMKLLGSVAAIAVAVVVAMGAYSRGSAAPPDAKGDAPPAKVGDAEAALKKEMAEEARVVFEARRKQCQAGAGAGGVCVDELHRWSVRWLEAELDRAADAADRGAALKAHLERMADVERLAGAIAKVGQGRASDAAAGRYYRAEAELWAARGRTK